MEYGSELHQSVVYIHCLHITLVHAQNINSYFIVIGFVVIEIFAFFRSDAWWGGPHAYTGHLPIDYVICPAKCVTCLGACLLTQLSMVIYELESMVKEGRDTDETISVYSLF